MDSGLDVTSLHDFEPCEDKEDHTVTIHTNCLFFICFGVNDKVCAKHPTAYLINHHQALRNVDQLCFR